MAGKKNIKVNGKEYFRITKTIGHKYVDGKRVPVRKQFLGSSKRKAEEAYEKWKEEQKSSILSDDRTFGDVADYYVKNVLSVNSKYSPGTRDKYEKSYANHVRPSALTRKMISHVKAEDIQILYNELDITKSALASVNKFMVGFFKWAFRNGYANNIMDAVVIPEKKDNRRTEEGEIIVWTDAELETIISNMKNHRLRLLVVLAVNAGMRISELLGLKYSDFDGRNLDIRRQYCDGDFRLPKGNSVRSVPMNTFVMQEIELHRQWHGREMKRNGYKTEYVFTSNTGKLLDRGNVRRSLDRYYANVGIDHKKFHAYRATFCTNLCKAGVPIQTASKLMGHKSIEVTSRFYTSVSRDEKQNAVDLLPNYAAKRSVVQNVCVK